jgi:Flp pilus assembly protein TadG
MKLLTCMTRRPDAKRGGATTVEVALTLPIFGVLMAGLMEFSHYYMVVHTLNAAAREGALLGSYQGTTNGQVAAKVNTIVAAAFNTSKSTVSVKDAKVFDTSNVNPQTVNYNALPALDLTKCKSADCFLVQVTVPYDNVALLPPYWIKSATVTGRAVTRHE